MSGLIILIIVLVADFAVSILAEMDEDKYTLKVVYRYIICIPLLGFLAINSMGPAATDNSLLFLLVGGYVIGCIILFTFAITMPLVIACLMGMLSLALMIAEVVVGFLALITLSLTVEVTKLISLIKRKKFLCK
jgi:hypothetical protein